MSRWRNALLVAVTLAVGGCGAAGATTSTTSTVATSPTAASTAAPTAIPTLMSTTEKASEGLAGAIPIRMTATNAKPRFEPDNVTARAGTVVFFLENIPAAFLDPHHNMHIGPAIGQELARTPGIRANEKVTFTVKDLTPGTYVFWCSVVGLDNFDHAHYGMVGTLTITP
jgi:plastocyanin